MSRRVVVFDLWKRSTDALFPARNNTPRGTESKMDEQLSQRRRKAADPEAPSLDMLIGGVPLRHCTKAQVLAWVRRQEEHSTRVRRALNARDELA